MVFQCLASKVLHPARVLLLLYFNWLGFTFQKQKMRKWNPYHTMSIATLVHSWALELNQRSLRHFLQQLYNMKSVSAPW